MRDPKVLWDSIRNVSGWPWALSTIKQDRSCLDLAGPNWGESILHWAMLGSMEACAELLALEQNLLSRLDMEGRTAMDWGLEKIYFIKDDAKTHGLDGRGEAMIAQARSCLLMGFNWILAQKYNGAWTGDGRRFLQLALSSGELEVALQATRAGVDVGAEVWLCGLAGSWESLPAAKKYLNELAQRFGVQGDALIYGLPLGLHAAQLWCAGSISDEAFVRLHNAGARVDVETEQSSLESLYAVSAKKDTDALSEILIKLGL